MIWGIEGRHLWLPGPMAAIVGDDVAGFMAIDWTDPVALGNYLIERDPFNPAFIPPDDEMIARSDFSTETTVGPVALTGKNLGVGGTWEGFGDADDFQVVGSNLQQAYRTAVQDGSAITQAREIVASGSGATTNFAAELRINFDAIPATNPYLGQGLIGRFTDMNNTLGIELQAGAGSGGSFLKVEWAVGGVLGPAHSASVVVVPGVDYVIRAYASADGRVRAWLDEASLVPPLVDVSDPALATGGALDNGKVGMIDHYTVDPMAITRVYDDFRAYVPTYDPSALPQPVFLNRLTDDADSPVFPRRNVKKITGLSGSGDSDDRRDNRIGAQGEIPRRSFRRGKTITYEGQVEAMTRAGLRQAEADMRAAFDDQAFDGLMVVTPHPLYDASGDYRYFNARALTCDIDDAATFSPHRVTQGHQSPFVVALRNARRGGVSYYDQDGVGYP